jgi:nitrogen regulatory protein P-II 2
MLTTILLIGIIGCGENRNVCEGRNKMALKRGGDDDMKLVTAIIKPFKLDDVRSALSKIGVQDVTVTEVKGFQSSSTSSSTQLYRGVDYLVDFLPKLKLDIIATSAELGQIIDTIISSTSTGNIGDGKIFVSELEHIIKF